MKNHAKFYLPFGALATVEALSTLDHLRVTGDTETCDVVFERPEDSFWLANLVAELTPLGHPVTDAIVDKAVKGEYTCWMSGPDFSAISMDDMFDAMVLSSLDEAADHLANLADIDGYAEFDPAERFHWTEQGVQERLGVLAEWLLAVKEGRA